MKLIVMTLISVGQFNGMIAQAAELPFRLSSEFDLTKKKAEDTFFNLMCGPTPSCNKESIKRALDEEYVSPIEIAKASELLQGFEHFDHINGLARKLNGDRRGLAKLAQALEGKTIEVPDMWKTLMGTLKREKLVKSTVPASQVSRLASALVPIVALSSGRGVRVQLDEETYCYNYGYAIGSLGKDREQDQQDRKSGRSYGASIERNAYDPSDRDYLKLLSSYTSEARQSELRQFYLTVFEILLKSDTSRIKKLSPLGQTLIADFVAIYMAELDRHLMTGLKMYEWENALTELTMLAAYSAHDDGKTFDPNVGAENTNERTVVPSKGIDREMRMVAFFGVGEDGSGLDGRNKSRRHKLTRQIVAAVRVINPEIVSRITKLIGARSNSDVYDDYMEFLNNYNTQAKIREQSDEFLEAIVDFVMETRKSAKAISRSIK